MWLHSGFLVLCAGTKCTNVPNKKVSLTNKTLTTMTLASGKNLTACSESISTLSLEIVEMQATKLLWHVIFYLFTLTVNKLNARRKNIYVYCGIVDVYRLLFHWYLIEIIDKILLFLFILVIPLALDVGFNSDPWNKSKKSIDYK